MRLSSAAARRSFAGEPSRVLRFFTETLQAHLDTALRAPVPAIAYELSRLFARRQTGAFVLETNATINEFDGYAKLGHCTQRKDPRHQSPRHAPARPRALREELRQRARPAPRRARGLSSRADHLLVVPVAVLQMQHLSRWLLQSV
jgi:hypothetical protein